MEEPETGDRRSRVVLARPRVSAFTGFGGARCDVERSRDGVSTVGGVGAGRYETGAVVLVVDGALGFGAGGERCGLWVRMYGDKGR